MRNKLTVIAIGILCAWAWFASAQNQDIRRGGGGGGQPSSANLTNWSNVATNEVVFTNTFRVFTNTAIIGVTNAGNSSFSLINSSNAPVPAFKSLSGAGSIILTNQGTNIVIYGSSSSTGYLLVREEQPAGTDGGTFTSGAWRTRTLNSIPNNDIGASLTTNTVTLPAGIYRAYIQAPAVRVNTHQAILTNLTAGRIELIGTCSFTASAAGDGESLSIIRGLFTNTVSSEFQIQHRGTTTASGLGFGNGGGGTSFTTNYFTVGEFFKVGNYP